MLPVPVSALDLGVAGMTVARVRRNAAVLERDLRLSARRWVHIGRALSQSRYSSEVIL